MKIQDVREMGDTELHEEIKQLRQKVFELGSQAVTEKLEDPSQIIKTRRNIARMLTVLRERQLARQDGK